MIKVSKKVSFEFNGKPVSMAVIETCSDNWSEQFQTVVSSHDLARLGDDILAYGTFLMQVSNPANWEGVECGFPRGHHKIEGRY